MNGSANDQTRRVQWLSDKDYKLVRESVPMLAVDGVVVHNSRVLLVKRRTKPYEGYWALPGGHVRFKERVEQAVIRQVREETNLEAEISRLVGVYSDPARDPWGHIVTIGYLLRWVRGELIDQTADASEVRFFDQDQLPSKIGFDHAEIIADALSLIERARNSKA